MRFISDHLNLLVLILILVTAIPHRDAQTLDDVWFPSANFTSCYQHGAFNVSAVTRYFNVKTSSYHLNFTSKSNAVVNNLNQQGSSTYRELKRKKPYPLPSEWNINLYLLPINDKFSILCFYVWIKVWISNIPSTSPAILSWCLHRLSYPARQKLYYSKGNSHAQWRICC